MESKESIGISTYESRRNGELIDLHVDSFEWNSSHTGIYIKWYSKQLGWGEYYISFDEEKQTMFVDSECMDFPGDMKFLEALLRAIPKSEMH